MMYGRVNLRSYIPSKLMVWNTETYLLLYLDISPTDVDSVKVLPEGRR